MVSWRRLFPDASGHDGTVSAYRRLVTTDGNPAVSTYDRNYGAVLASPGIVDANAPTRQQYVATDAFQPLFGGSAGFTFVQADLDANPGKVMSASLFVAPASAFAAGVTPTPAQIRTAATWVGRGATRATAGNLDATAINAISMIGAPLPPNTKYWLMVCPTAVVDGSTPSIANDVPVGDVNALGRGLSVWSNRTPLAPVITAPVGQTTVFSGQTVSLTFSPRDPDRITWFPGDRGPNDFDDMAGFQIQYAPRPTEEVPDPTWTDLPIADLTGMVYGTGWYLDETTAPNTEGAYYVWLNRKIVIQCGTRVGYAANSAYLPAGDWQIRVRTFDYGHGWSDSTNRIVSPPGVAGYPPLADATHSYTPSNYPAVNTSPWSTPVRIFVTAQVPKPVPVEPINNRAVTEGLPVTLSWQYRNTYSPPYPQSHKTVQVRKIGATSWTTLFDGASASPSYALSAGDLAGLVSGNQYEWRVKARDSSGVWSDWSDVARFWVVPAPISGDVIPTPSETIDEATLGCGTHRVLIFRRGGKKRVGEITNISSVEWNRVRDDISTAKITVSGWGVDCGNLLARLRTWAYEVVIFRDNGYTVDRVWEGPITLLTYESDKVTIQAKDVMGYAYRRIIKQDVVDSGKSPTAGSSVVNRATRVLSNAFAPDDPNVLAYLHPLVREDDAKQYRSTPAYSRTAFEEVDDMAANAGLDYTAVGRKIMLWGTKHRIGTLPEFRDKDLGNSPIVSEYGMSMANVYAVSDGNGVYGEATRLDEFDKDDTYGLVEMLSSTWASDSEEESGTYTQEGLETVRASFAEAAERSIASRYPAPVVVRIPDNTRLSADTVLSIQHLVPGVIVPLRSTSTLRTVVASQKLDSVKVIEAGGEETITITLSPFSRDDNDPGEGEGEA